MMLLPDDADDGDDDDEVLGHPGDVLEEAIVRIHRIGLLLARSDAAGIPAVDAAAVELDALLGHLQAAALDQLRSSTTNRAVMRSLGPGRAGAGGRRSG